MYADTGDGIMGTNMYAYCQGDPVNYSDPKGYWIETIWDAASLAMSTNDLINDPSWVNAGWLLLDVASVVIPGLPALGSIDNIAKGGVKVASKADEALKLAKIADDAPTVVSKIDDAPKIASKADEALKANKATDFVVTPKGDAIPVPKGATGPSDVINKAGKTTGFAFNGGSGGYNGKVYNVRIMDPTPPRGGSPGYPNGYAIYGNVLNQGVDPITGLTAPKTKTHFPLR